MFLLNSCLDQFSAASFLALLIPKLRSHFAEFLNNTSSVGLRILSSSTCVGLRYGYSMNNSGFSRQPAHDLRYFYFAPHHVFTLCGGFACHTATSLDPVFPFPDVTLCLCPHSSVILQYRNFNLLSIDYVFRPCLRSRLTQSRSALLWKPWIFGQEDSHLFLATHSGILSSCKSTAPFGTASSSHECSSTNTKSIPQLRCCVLAPDIFGAEPLD